MTSSPQNWSFKKKDNCFWREFRVVLMRPLIYIHLQKILNYTNSQLVHFHFSCPVEVINLVSDISKKCGTFKWFGNFSVWFTDNLINCFLPAGVRITALFNISEELAEWCQRALQELIGYLNQVLVPLFRKDLSSATPESAFNKRYKIVICNNFNTERVCNLTNCG